MVARAVSSVHGVLLFDKDVGVSSNGALQSVRRLYGRAKAGHTGTLDPLASGLLPICFGEATKFAHVLLAAPKSYQATLKLGFKSSTGDAEGEVVAVSPPAFAAAHLDAVLGRYRGRISQTPPVHSALKHNGRPLYAYARAGIEVERQARQVEIIELAMRDLVDDELSISVTCSKGTYIRTLAQDIGEDLGCGAYLTALRRTATAQFGIAEACDLERLQGLDATGRAEVVLPIDVLLNGMPSLCFAEEQASKLMCGQAVTYSVDVLPGEYRLYGPGKVFLGVGSALAQARIAPQRMVSASSVNA